MSSKELLEFYQGVEVNPTVRWEAGTEHHPRALELMQHLKFLNSEQGGDAVDLETGGDGDAGESLLYLLDMYFEAQEIDPRLRKARNRKSPAMHVHKFVNDVCDCGVQDNEG